MSPLAAATLDAVKRVARIEIMPRYLKVAHERKSDGSLCTQADIAAQNYLTRELKQIADCPVLGEEMHSSEQAAVWHTAVEGLWCVDPIDGTSNFVNGIPYFGVSVAFMQNHRPLLGIVYDPIADEAFYAEAGRGAYLNGVPLPIKEMVPESLKRAVAAVDLKRLSLLLGEAIGRKPPYSSHRNFGASALDWCYEQRHAAEAIGKPRQRVGQVPIGAPVAAAADHHRAAETEDILQPDVVLGQRVLRDVAAAGIERIFGGGAEQMDVRINQDTFRT